VAVGMHVGMHGGMHGGMGVAEEKKVPRRDMVNTAHPHGRDARGYRYAPPPPDLPIQYYMYMYSRPQT